MIRFIAMYDGILFESSNEGKYVCLLEKECRKGRIIDDKDIISAPVTKAADKEDFAAFTDSPPTRYESGIEGRDPKECPLTKSPYFAMLMIKVLVFDVLLTIATIALVLVHRMHIIPARRRFRIVMGIMKRRHKRDIRTRAQHRLRKLNFLRRKLERDAKKGSDDSSSSSSNEGFLLTAAEGGGVRDVRPAATSNTTAAASTMMKEKDTAEN
uniref:G_PROTEIN_RECEP_F1_2 domain-containing protein n=1 Tax=Ascaris lumbricoides TaxID=6252 RepID=A0A0M3HZH6_ASCLU